MAVDGRKDVVPFRLGLIGPSVMRTDNKISGCGCCERRWPAATPNVPRIHRRYGDY